MSAPAVTVAVLNHRRPHLLERVLTGVLQLDYPAFEIVVVGDRPQLSDYDLRPAMARMVRYFACDRANICRARNIAVQQAAGEIVAFCDDDAVPEPDWLRHLAPPFATADLGAAVGTVRCPDRIEPEWAGGVFDRSGTEHPLVTDEPVCLADAASQLASGRFMALRGVNSAFRRAAVHAVGGFDEAYRYYLDETDIALRLARAGWAAAFVRGAEVLHLSEENVARGTRRQPRDLFEVAASRAYFCRRHLTEEPVESAIATWRASRLNRMDPYIRLGLVRGADRRQLEQRMDDGLAEGRQRSPELPLAAEMPTRPFHAVTTPGSRLRIAIVTGRGALRRSRLHSFSRQLAAAGHRVGCFSHLAGLHVPAAAYQGGVWLHRGSGQRPAATAPDGEAPEHAGSGRGGSEKARSRRRFQVILCPTGRRERRDEALLTVAGLGQPLSVRLTGDCHMELPEVMKMLRRVPGEAEPGGTAPGDGSGSGWEPMFARLRKYV